MNTTMMILNVVLAGATQTVGSSPVATADLAIAQSVSDESVELGDLLVYVIRVGNDGPSTARAVQLTVKLPKGATFLWARTKRGACRTQAGRGKRALSCRVDSVAASNRPWSIEFALRVTAPIGSTLSNTAMVTSSTPDTNLLNNVASITTKVLTQAPKYEKSQ